MSRLNTTCQHCNRTVDYPPESGGQVWPCPYNDCQQPMTFPCGNGVGVAAYLSALFGKIILFAGIFCVLYYFLSGRFPDFVHDRLHKQVGIKLVDVYMSPHAFLDKQVTVQGKFRYRDEEDSRFRMMQGDLEITVIYEKVLPSQLNSILKEKSYSESWVTVVGELQKFSNRDNTYYINATSVTFK